MEFYGPPVSRHALSGCSPGPSLEPRLLACLLSPIGGDHEKATTAGRRATPKANDGDAKGVAGNPAAIGGIHVEVLGLV